MMNNMKIYLASPLFTEFEKGVVRDLAEKMRGIGFDVYVPMEHQIENAWDYSNDEWARHVFEEDVKAINECDVVVCAYYGLYSDSGTAWECGYAYAKGKKIQLVDMANDEVSLMMVQSAFNKDEFKQKSQT